MIHLICNPHAKRCKGKFLEKVGKKLHKADVKYTVFYTKEYGDIGSYVTEVCGKEEHPTLVAVGGDGTINAVLSAIPDPSKVDFAIIPAGTGNDFVKAARIPVGLKAVELLIHGNPKPTDYLQSDDGHRSMNIAGLGIDVDILERYEANLRAGKKGKYYACLLAALKHYQPVPMRVETEHGEREYNALIAVGCNGQYFGGGIRICPVGVVDDGLMDLVVVDFPKRSKIFFYLIALKLGTILKSKIAHHERCTRVTILPKACERVQYDGELIEAASLSLTLMQGGINMYRG